MKLFGRWELTPELREDAIRVVAASLLIVAGGKMTVKALDTSGALLRLEQIEKRLQTLEEKSDQR